MSWIGIEFFFFSSKLIINSIVSLFISILYLYIANYLYFNTLIVKYQKYRFYHLKLRKTEWGILYPSGVVLGNQIVPSLCSG